MVENTMDLQTLVGKQLEEAEPDVLRQLLADVIGRVRRHGLEQRSNGSSCVAISEDPDLDGNESTLDEALARSSVDYWCS